MVSGCPLLLYYPSQDTHVKSEYILLTCDKKSLGETELVRDLEVEERGSSVPTT